MDEVPHRSVVDHETALSQLGHQTAQREGPLAAARDQPQAVLASDLARLVTAHLARLKAAGLAPPPDPVDHRAHPEPKPRCHRVAGQTVNLDRPNRMNRPGFPGGRFV